MKYGKERERVGQIVAQNLRELRAEKGMSQEQLFLATGVLVKEIEKGKQAPNLITLYRLAKGMGVPLHELVEGL